MPRVSISSRNFANPPSIICNVTCEQITLREHSAARLAGPQRHRPDLEIEVLSSGCRLPKVLPSCGRMICSSGEASEGETVRRRVDAGAERHLVTEPAGLLAGDRLGAPTGESGHTLSTSRPTGMSPCHSRLTNFSRPVPVSG